MVARLGGPATPDSDPVMRVTADAPVLLRGSIRRTYTGHTWVDSDAKARYLFYDFTRKRVREDVFGMTVRLDVISIRLRSGLPALLRHHRGVSL